MNCETKYFFLLLSVLLSGCAYLNVDPNPTTTTTATTTSTTTTVLAPVPEPAAFPYRTERGYRGAGILQTGYGVMLCTYKVNRRPKRSRVRLLRNGIWDIILEEDGVETIGQPWLNDKRVHFPSEWRKHCLSYLAGEFHNGARSLGNWNVCGAMVRGRPAYPFNADYRGADYRGSMKDYPRVIDGLTGEHLFTVPAKFMPRSIVYPWVAGNFGEVCTVNMETGRKVSNAPAIFLFVLGEQLYGWGAGGVLFRMGAQQWEFIEQGECTAGM